MEFLPIKDLGSYRVFKSFCIAGAVSPPWQYKNSLKPVKSEDLLFYNLAFSRQPFKRALRGAHSYEGNTNRPAWIEWLILQEPV